MTYSVYPSPPGVTALGKGSLHISWMVAAGCIALPLIMAIIGAKRKHSTSVVQITLPPGKLMASPAAPGGDSEAEKEETAVDMALEVQPWKPNTVFVASLEYIITHEGGVEKAVAGGLGKVAGLLCQYHPGALICVHACMRDKTYPFATREEPLHVVVSGKPETCKVYRYDVAGEEPEAGSKTGAPPITFYLVDHQFFREREEIYPTPQTRQRTVEFYSLWNQAVARLIDRTKPDMYHCPDFHAAMAVMYIERPLPVTVILHNAEYQGAIATQHMGKKEADWFAQIFDLPAHRVRREAFHEGKFSMLKPIVDHARRYQAGRGICAVSRNYALEAAQKHAVLWGLPEVRGIENCMPETERMAAVQGGEEEYLARRVAAKAVIQGQYKMSQDPEARIFVFVGRWVKQKGIDYIADVAEWMLSEHKDAQLIMIGPVGDAYGSYAKEKMERLRQSGRFAGQLFVHAGFLTVPQELKLACDFCLMPSRDEPFGYVDIEFAWYGAAVVGSLRGGLGKLPGFYFQILNSDSSAHMQRSLRKAIVAAMRCDRDELARMSQIARRSAFPVEEWQREMSDVYSVVMQSFDWEAMGAMPTWEEEGALPPLTSIPSGEIATEASSPLSSRVNSCTLPTPPASARGHTVPPLYMTPRQQLSFTPRQPQLSHRSVTSVSVSLVDLETSTAISELSAKPVDEFLRQEPSEVEMQEQVESKMNQSKRVTSAAKVLEEVEWEMQMQKETDWVARFLLKRVFDAPILDWIICLSYITGPLVTALPVSYFSGEDSIAFFVIDPLTQACALIFWTICARFTAPNLLMAVASLTRLVLILVPASQFSPRITSLIVGCVAPSDYLFIYYAFMGSSVGDVAKLATRTGLIMALRDEWQWLFLGFQLEGAKQRTMATAIACVLFSVLPALALLRAPRLYREFRLPSFDFSWINKLHFLLLLALASVIHALSHVSESSLLVMRQTSPFELKERQLYAIALGLATALPMCLLGVLMRRLPSYAMVIVRSIACFSLPSVLLRVWAQYEINQSTELSFGLDLLIFLSAILGALAVYAVAVSVLATVGSRWRFVTYTCVVGVCTNLARMCSFGIIAYKTGHPDPLKASYLPHTLAWELLVVAVPPCALALLLRMLAFFWFDREATGMLRTSRQRRLVRVARRNKSNKVLEKRGLLEASTSFDSRQPEEEEAAASARPSPMREAAVIVDVLDVPPDNSQASPKQSSTAWSSTGTKGSEVLTHKSVNTGQTEASWRAVVENAEAGTKPSEQLEAAPAEALPDVRGLAKRFAPHWQPPKETLDTTRSAPP